MTKSKKQKLYGICKELNNCTCGLCPKITAHDETPSEIGTPEDNEQPPTGSRKPRIPEFCRLNINNNKIGWYS